MYIIAAAIIITHNNIEDLPYDASNDIYYISHIQYQYAYMYLGTIDSNGCGFAFSLFLLQYFLNASPAP